MSDHKEKPKIADLPGMETLEANGVPTAAEKAFSAERAINHNESPFSQPVVKKPLPERKKNPSRGYPVPKGCTWRDLSPQQRAAWLHQHEQRWKSQYEASQKKHRAMIGWTRG